MKQSKRLITNNTQVTYSRVRVLLEPSASKWTVEFSEDQSALFLSAEEKVQEESRWILHCMFYEIQHSYIH